MNISRTLTFFGLLFIASNVLSINNDSLKNLLQSPEKTKAELAEINLQIAQSFFDAFIYDSALIYSTVAINEFEKLSIDKKYATSLELHSNILKKLSFNNRLIPIQHRLINILEKLQDSSELMGAYDRMGLFYYHMSITDSAIYYYQKSYEIGKLMNNEDALINSFNNLSQIYNFYGDFDKELEYCKKGLEIAVANSDPGQEAIFYHNIALAYIHLEQLDSALVNAHKAIKKNSLTNDLDRLALNKTALGNIFAMQGDIPKAMEYFQEVLTYHTKVGNLHGQAEGNYNLGFSYFYLEDYVPAQKYFFEALRLAKIAKLSDYEVDIYGNLSEVSAGQDDYRKALKYFQLFKQLSDSINKSTNLALISKFQSEYEYERNSNKIILLSKENEIQARVVRNTISIAIITSLSLLFLGILLFFLLRKLRRNEELTSQLTEQNIAIKEYNESLEVMEEITQEDLKYANNLQARFFDNISELKTVFKESFYRTHTQKPVENTFLWTNKLGNKLYWSIISIGQDRIQGAFTSMYLYNMLNKVYYDKNFLGVESFTQTFIQDAFGNDHHEFGHVQMCFCSYDMKKSELDFVNFGISIELIRNAKVWDFKTTTPHISPEKTNAFIVHKILLQEQDELIIFNKNWSDNTHDKLFSAGNKMYNNQDALITFDPNYQDLMDDLLNDENIKEFLFLSVKK